MKQHSNLRVEVLSVCTRFLKEGIPLPVKHISPLLQLLWLQAQPPVSFYCTTLDGRLPAELGLPTLQPTDTPSSQNWQRRRGEPQRDASEAGGESGQCKEC